jgi:CO/xanthine dehydrogenase Mo-binding subunit
LGRARANDLMIVEVQVLGGAYYQGIAAALYEEFEMDKGLTLNPNLVDYKRPRAYEAPMTKVFHVITKSSQIWTI